MHLNSLERDLFLDLAFFAEDTTLLSHKLRPLSLASFKALRLMQLTVMDETHQLTPQQETREIAAFVWLHTAPIPDICRALWDGSWRVIMESFEEPLPTVVNEFREWKMRALACIEAADIHIRPRPRSEHDHTPRDVIAPTGFAFTVGTVSRHTGLPPRFVRWHMFLGEALQHYHSARWSEGAWTVRKASKTTEAQFDGLGTEFLAT